MDVVVLYHGTDAASADDILQNGIDAAKAAQYNSTGEFWATTDSTVAEWFARVNLANGPPTRFRFEVPESVLQALVAAQPTAARTDGQGTYEFLPAGFPALNQHMTGKQVSPVI